MNARQRLDSVNRTGRRARTFHPTASRLLALIALAFLAGCQSLPSDSRDRPAYSLPEGTELVLRTPLTVPAERYSVYFQLGKIVSERDFYHWEYGCKLVMKQKRPNDYALSPRRFRIERVKRSESVFGNFILIQNTRFYLSSPENPEVDKLTCSIWTNVPPVGQISIKELEKALGEYFQLEIHGS